MKKSKFIVGLSAAFISAVALMSCAGAIRAKDGVVLTINGVDYTAEQLFNDQKTPAAAEAKFNAVYRVAVRNYFLEGQDGYQYMQEITNDTKAEISRQKVIAQENADKSGTSYDEEWEKILDSNNVDDEAGLYDKFEYDKQKAKFEEKLYDYDYKVGENTTNNYSVLRNGGKLKDRDGKEHGSAIKGYLNGKNPYHVRHILVKIAGAKGSDETNVTITKDEADKLSTVIRELANGTKFGKVAALSDDEGSAAKKGDLGIMDRDTSFVNDFKLGTYLYESFYGYNSNPTYRNAAKKGLGLDKTGSIAAEQAELISKLNDPTTTPTSDGLHGIGQIPYEAALLLSSEKTWTETAGATSISGAGLGDVDYTTQHFKNFKAQGVEDNAKYYPRNVIFNKYFNKHNIMVITPRRTSITIADLGGGEGTKNYPINRNAESLGSGGNLAKAMNQYVPAASSVRVSDDKYKGDEETTVFTKLPGFAHTAGTIKNNDTIDENLLRDDDTATAASNSVLRDENGRVIFVFRSGTGANSSNDDQGYFGIHFVVVERSPFVDSETNVGPDGQSYTTSLDQYYTEYYPGQDGGRHPTYKDKSDKDQPMLTYANYINAEKIDLKSRADEVKNKLKACDANLNTYIYEYLLSKGNLQFSGDLGESIKNNISEWITDTKRNSTAIEDEDKWDNTWQDYSYSLQEQQEKRHVWNLGTAGYKSLVVSEACAILYFALNGDNATDETLITHYFGEGGVFHE